MLQQAEHFCNSIGVLQQCSLPSKFPGFDRTGNTTPQQTQQEDYAQLFSTLIARYECYCHLKILFFYLCLNLGKKNRCAKDIDSLIETLPSEDSTLELQVQSFKRLEIENQEAADRLEEVYFKKFLIV